MVINENQKIKELYMKLLKMQTYFTNTLEIRLIFVLVLMKITTF